LFLRHSDYYGGLGIGVLIQKGENHMPKSFRFILPLLLIVALVALALPSSASNSESTLRQETPTVEATVDVTETATVEPTATDVVPVELLVNGGFEGLDGDGDLEPWIHAGNPGEKVKCNKNNKVFAHSGNCAFRFKGNPLKSGTVSQDVDLTGYTVGLGDTLTFSLWIDGKATADGNGKAKVRYDTGGKGKAKVNFNPTSGYVQVIDGLAVEADITTIKIVLKHAGAAGRFLVDDVSLLLTEGEVPSATATATVDMTATPEATETTQAELVPLP
jgi:hypothetical protein